MKKSTLTLTMMSLALGGSLYTAAAQDANTPPSGEKPVHPPREGRPGPDGQGRGPRPPAPLFMALDANHDGILSAEEIVNGLGTLKQLDKNGDGQLTAEEMRPPQGERPERGAARRDGQERPERPERPEQPRGPHRPVAPLFHALDANHDGTISSEELANAPTALKQLDKNKDGQLTPDEVRPPMGMFPGGRGDQRDGRAGPDHRRGPGGPGGPGGQGPGGRGEMRQPRGDQGEPHEGRPQRGGPGEERPNQGPRNPGE